MTVDELIAKAQAGGDANEIRRLAALINHDELSKHDLDRLHSTLELLPRRSGLLTMGGG
jgi:hypothetical protein